METYPWNPNQIETSLTRARWIFALLVLISIALPLYFYPQLPARTASHFNLHGQVDGWNTRTTFVGFQIGISLFLTLTTLGIIWLIKHASSELINIPNKQYWLTPERKQYAYGIIELYLLWMMNLTFFLLLVVFYLVTLFNLKRFVLSPWSFFVPIGLYTIGIGVLLFKMFRAFKIPRNGERTL